LSTDDGDKARKLRDAASGYGRGEVRIRVVPNRGRDIGAFLTGFADDIVTRYQIVGHVHGKRSLHAGGTDPFFGERWREFLWQNLIGDLHPMMDLILARFAGDERLGIVFPDDPYLHDWDGNRSTAEELAARMGMTNPLPPYFDFPVGTMFWARTAALKPLFDLKLGWDDYPREPAANDGTILNAIERLLPFAAGHAGYRFAATHVAGVTR
jgi:lipopolysaccharide biosynthesis protein